MFPAGQATFLVHLPTGQSPRQAAFQLNPKGQAGFFDFFQPCGSREENKPCIYNGFLEKELTEDTELQQMPCRWSPPYFISSPSPPPPQPEGLDLLPCCLTWSDHWILNTGYVPVGARLNSTPFPHEPSPYYQHPFQP